MNCHQDFSHNAPVVENQVQNEMETGAIQGVIVQGLIFLTFVEGHGFLFRSYIRHYAKQQEGLICPPHTCRELVQKRVRGKGQKLGPISERNFIYIDLKVFAFIHIKMIVELKMQQQGKNNLRLGKRYPKRQVQTGGII